MTQIINSNIERIDDILQIYTMARAYQQHKGYNLWPIFEKEYIAAEIKEKRHYTVLVNQQIAVVFSVVFDEPTAVWEDAADGTAIYLHQIATHRDFKGKNLLASIIEWVKSYGKLNAKSFIRMNTWADNKILTEYYLSHGFTLLRENFVKKEDAIAAGLPAHYYNSKTNLFQMEIL